MLVVNETSPVSMDVGAYYAQKRGIPESNILRIRTGTDDDISPANFQGQIHQPIAAWLTRNFAQDRILYIVLTKGIPLRITGTSGKDGIASSVDSELTLLYPRMMGQNIAVAGPVGNPYFLKDSPMDQAKQFSHQDYEIYLVSRLDGYTTADIYKLIDNGFAPAKEGKILLDEKGSSDEKGNAWLRETAENLKKLGSGDRVVLDTSDKALKGHASVLGYYSWGSNDPGIQVRNLGMAFVPGALAGMFVSSDGRTFTEPPADWQIGTWDNRDTHFAGSPQSLAGDLIREGVTGIAAYVAEPFLEATVRPNILFPAYLSGFNLIESYYLAMPYLSWQTVVVGDPLCAPFRKSSLSAEQADPGIDPEIELPRFIGARKLKNTAMAAYKSAGVPTDAIKPILRAEARLAKNDRPGAKKALEEYLELDDKLPSPQIILANLYELDGVYDKAIERYRRILELSPDHATALNNLAYALAVRKNSVQEALPLAEKAYAVSNKNPNVADTLGWIHHLAGQDDKAAEYLEEAARSGIPNAQIHLHFAIVSAAIGNTLQAEVALERALEIDPDLGKTEEVKQLKQNLE